MKKRKIKKRFKIIVIILFLLIIVGVIGFIVLSSTQNKEQKVSNNKEEKEEKPEIKEEPKLKILDLESNTRPYAVMINNISTVWGYQSGLQEAYLVYEMLVEGGYTRLMAVYKDKTLDRIGSVRSSRHYFLDYALENDAIYVHFGWSPYAQSDIRKLGINNINFLSYNGYVRDRTLGLASEHTAFTTTNNIMEGANYYGYRTTSDATPVLNYSIEEIDISTMDGAIPANEVFINYSRNRSTSFIYDAENKIYKRYQNSVEHTDYVTKTQYTAKNIITYQLVTHAISSTDKKCQEIITVGSGDGYYITNGYAVPIKWTKESRSSKTIYTYLDGTEINVNDGNTHIQIQPKGQTLTIN